MEPVRPTDVFALESGARALPAGGPVLAAVPLPGPGLRSRGRAAAPVPTSPAPHAAAGVAIAPDAPAGRLAGLPLRVLSTHTCPFFGDRQATVRGVYSLKRYGRAYADLLAEGYWRRTDVIERPACRSCAACQSVRVLVRRFEPTRSQRRCWRRNQDLAVEVADYAVDPETLDLFRRYLIGRHGWGRKADPDRLDNVIDWYAHRLGRSPVKCRAFKYRLDGVLVGLSVADDCRGALYSAFFAYDLAHARRSLGTFSAMYEVAWARKRRKQYYYMANLIDGFEPSRYKATFHPHEVRDHDGVWRLHAPGGDAF